MTGEPTLRQVTPEDWALLRATRLAMLLDEPSAYGSSFARELAFAEDTWRERTGAPTVLAERSDGLPLGSATLLPEPSTQDPEIVAMWVPGHARGSGVADELVRACLAIADEQDASRVRLHVMTDNPRAVAFYTRMGFRFDGECGNVEGCEQMSRETALDVSSRHGGGAPGRR